MSRVTSVEPQKTLRLRSGRGPLRFNIYLDGQFAFGVDEDLVVDHRLLVGKIIEQGDLEEILFDGEVGKLIERVYRLSNIRMRSEKEIRDYLKNLSFKRKTKGEEEISGVVIESTIDRAIKKGLINDEEFARSWIQSRTKKKGIRLVKGELIQKGVSYEIIENILNDSNYFNKLNEGQVAKSLLEKKIKIWKNLPTLEFRKKSYNFLMRRGFDYLVVKDVVEKFLKKD